MSVIHIGNIFKLHCILRWCSAYTLAISVILANVVKLMFAASLSQHFISFLIRLSPMDSMDLTKQLTLWNALSYWPARTCTSLPARRRHAALHAEAHAASSVAFRCFCPLTPIPIHLLQLTFRMTASHDHCRTPGTYLLADRPHLPILVSLPTIYFKFVSRHFVYVHLFFSSYSIWAYCTQIGALCFFFWSFQSNASALRCCR